MLELCVLTQALSVKWLWTKAPDTSNVGPSRLWKRVGEYMSFEQMPLSDQVYIGGKWLIARGLTQAKLESWRPFQMNFTGVCLVW